MANDETTEKRPAAPVSHFHVSEDPHEEVGQLRAELLEAAKELNAIRRDLRSIAKSASRALMAAIVAVVALVLVLGAIPAGAYAVIHSANQQQKNLQAGIADNNKKLCILFSRTTSEDVIKSLPPPAQQALRESNARQQAFAITFGCVTDNGGPAGEEPGQIVVPGQGAG